MNRKLYSHLAAVLALLLVVLAAHDSNGQTVASRFSFRSGQTMYIVAFRRTQPPATVDSAGVSVVSRPDYYDYDLDAERKVRKRIEEWRFFRVVDKPSEADFVFFVNLDDSSIEGLVLPFDAYRQHFKDKVDLDALRDAAYGRYLAGPLKLATVTRLSDRLVKQFREVVTTGNKTANK